MSNINKRMSVHSGRLERWLGAERINDLSKNFDKWYGPPVQLLDVPGNVFVGGDGDFVGDFDRGFFDSALDSLGRYGKRLWKEMGKTTQLNAGFTSISDALGRASGGYSQPPFTFNKTGVTSAISVPMSLWAAAGQPAAGAIGSAAPGGRAPDDSTTGAFPYTNPSSGTLHLVGADVQANVAANALLLYDRIFDVAKNMNSSSAESVTGVPTRYQSSTSTAMDYAGGNFMFPEVITILAATAHNWDAMLYRNQAGTDAQTAPSMVGNSAGIANRLDTPLTVWFMPLATGDTGVMDLNSMKCSAAVATGTLDWVIGHPLGIMAFPTASFTLPFDWLTNRNQAPRIFDDACLAFLELPKGAATATTYTGMFYATSASA